MKRNINTEKIVFSNFESKLIKPILSHKTSNDNAYSNHTEESNDFSIAESFKLSSVNNLVMKNQYCFIGYDDSNFYDENKHLKQQFFDYYENVSKTNVGMIFTGGFVADLKFETQENDEIVFDDSEKLREFIRKIHSTGCKFFLQIKSAFGRADENNELFNFFPFSASFNKNYFHSKVPCLRISDSMLGKIIDEITRIVQFAKKSEFDGICINGDMFGLIGEISSTEMNRRNFGYYFDSNDFSIKLIKNIMKTNNLTNIFYSISLTSYIEDAYGCQSDKISSSKNFKRKIDIKKNINFLVKLVKSGVDGFIFCNGTYETEFLFSPNEFEGENILLEFYTEVSEYFKENEIKNKFGNDVYFIYRDNFQIAPSEIVSSENFFIDITNNILADNEYLFKLKNKKLCRNCIRCGFCSERKNSKSDIACIVNPSSLSKKDMDIIYTSNGKKVAIVGSGISGVNCAIFLAERGFTIDIYEKKDKLNQSSKLCEIYNFNTLLSRYNSYIDEIIDSYSRCGKINIFTNCEFTKDKILSNDYYSIILATGETEKFYQIPGAVLKNVYTIFEVLSNVSYFEGKNNITIDAKSELSLELAQYLLLYGKNVTVIISSCEFLMKMRNSRLTYFLYSLRKLNCKIFLFAKISRIESDFVEIMAMKNKATGTNFVSDILNLKSKAEKFNDTKMQGWDKNSAMDYESSRSKLYCEQATSRQSGEKIAKTIDSDIVIYEPETSPNNKLFYELVMSKFNGKIFMIGSSLCNCNFEESIKSAYFVAKNL